MRKAGRDCWKRYWNQDPHKSELNSPPIARIRYSQKQDGTAEMAERSDNYPVAACSHDTAFATDKKNIGMADIGMADTETIENPNIVLDNRYSRYSQIFESTA